VLSVLVPLVFMASVEVERVLAVVNGVPILASDVELAEAAALVPRQTGEGDAEYRRAVVGALLDLELRWQDLNAAGIALRMPIDLDAAWQATARKAGGEEGLRNTLAQIGLNERELRELVRHAAVVQAYVASRFAPFVRPTPQEVEAAWRQELAPQLEKEGKQVPPLTDVREKVEGLLRERKLSAEVERWTADLAKHAEIVRYLPVAGGPPPLPPPATPSITRIPTARQE
jgi:hypothetical protein